MGGQDESKSESLRISVACESAAAVELRQAVEQAFQEAGLSLPPEAAWDYQGPPPGHSDLARACCALSAAHGEI